MGGFTFGFLTLQIYTDFLKIIIIKKKCHVYFLQSQSWKMSFQQNLLMHLGHSGNPLLFPDAGIFHRTSVAMHHLHFSSPGFLPWVNDQWLMRTNYLCARSCQPVPCGPFPLTKFLWLSEPFYCHLSWNLLILQLLACFNSKLAAQHYFSVTYGTNRMQNTLKEHSTSTDQGESFHLLPFHHLKCPKIFHLFRIVKAYQIGNDFWMFAFAGMYPYQHFFSFSLLSKLSISPPSLLFAYLLLPTRVGVFLLTPFVFVKTLATQKLDEETDADFFFSMEPSLICFKEEQCELGSLKAIAAGLACCHGDLLSLY